MARRAIRDPWFWMSRCTKTKDEQDLANPYKPFPENWPYFQPILMALENEPVLFLEKSRTVMASWLVSAWAAWKMFTRPAVKVVFQSEDEDRAVHDVEYVKVLWEQSLDSLKSRWPLDKPLDKQPYFHIEMANGSSAIAIPGNPDKIKSEHPTIVIMDEAAIIQRGEHSFNVSAATRCPHLIALSSANPGWFRQATEFAVPVDWPEYPQNA